MNNDLYYKEKIIRLVERLFCNGKSAKEKFLDYENLLFDAYLASKMGGLPSNVSEHWESLWQKLNSEPELKNKKGEIISSRMRQTLQYQKNKNLEKYLLFLLEEFYRLLKK